MPLDLDEHPEALDLIRRAAARPECRFPDPGRITLLNAAATCRRCATLADAVRQSCPQPPARGDLAAAWDDIVVALPHGAARETRARR